MHCLERNYCILTQISFNVVPMCSIFNTIWATGVNQVITWSNVQPDLSLHTATLSHNELNKSSCLDTIWNITCLKSDRKISQKHLNWNSRSFLAFCALVGLLDSKLNLTIVYDEIKALGVVDGGLSGCTAIARLSERRENYRWAIKGVTALPSITNNSWSHFHYCCKETYHFTW